MAVDLFNRTIDEYQKLGVKVFLIEQAPRQDYTPESVYMSAYSNYKSEEIIATLTKYSLKYNKHKLSSKFINNVFSSKDYPVIVDIEKIYCNDKICPLGTLDVSYYGDGDHLSISGASLLESKIEGLLTEISSVEE